MVLEQIVGFGLVAGIFLMLGIKLDEQHTIYKLLCVLLASIMVLLIPFNLIEGETVCSLQNTNSTLTGGLTVYEYGKVCFTDAKNSTKTVMYVIYGFMTLTLLYWLIVSFKAVFAWIDGMRLRPPKERNQNDG